MAKKVKIEPLSETSLGERLGVLKPGIERPKSASERFMESVEIPLSAKFIEPKRKINGSDAIINISVETNKGKVDLEFLVISFCGNVSPSKQSLEGLRYMFKEIFIKEFGGMIK